jgi:hypothetical protein
MKSKFFNIDFSFKYPGKSIIIAKLILVPIFLLGFLSVPAQKKIIFIQARAGVSEPLGSFGESGVGTEYGYAETGKNLCIDGGYYIVNTAGVFLTYNTREFPFNQAQLGFDYGITATVGDYQTEFVGLGLLYEYDFKRKFSIMARICFGQHKATFPKQYYESGEETLAVPSNTQNKVSVPVALDFKYFIHQNFGLLVSVEYQMANQQHTWGVSGFYPVAAEWDISYKTLNLDAGIVFRL